MPRKISAGSVSNKDNVTNVGKERKRRRAFSLSPEMIEEVKEQLEEVVTEKAVIEEESDTGLLLNNKSQQSTVGNALPSMVKSMPDSSSECDKKMEVPSAVEAGSIQDSSVPTSPSTTTTVIASPFDMDPSIAASPTVSSSNSGCDIRVKRDNSYNSLPRPAARNSVSQFFVPQLRRIFERSKSCEPEVLPSSSPSTPAVKAKKWLKKRVQKKQDKKEGNSKKNVSNSNPDSSAGPENHDSNPAESCESVSSSFVDMSQADSSCVVGDSD